MPRQLSDLLRLTSTIKGECHGSRDHSAPAWWKWPPRQHRQVREGQKGWDPGACPDGRDTSARNSVAAATGRASNRPVSPTRKAGSNKAYNPIAPERIQEILKRLDDLYADVTCALQHNNVWELLVATILSAQSTDVRVNMVTPELFRKYPTVQDFAALDAGTASARRPLNRLFSEQIRSLVGAAKKIVNDFGGQVPETMDELLTLPGVARKTANVVLGSWFQKMKAWSWIRTFTGSAAGLN